MSIRKAHFSSATPVTNIDHARNIQNQAKNKTALLKLKGKICEQLKSLSKGKVADLTIPLVENSKQLTKAVKSYRHFKNELKKLDSSETKQTDNKDKRDFIEEK